MRRSVRGRALHAVREATNRAYLRKRLGVIDKRIDVSLASPRHHLRGRLDEVLFFDGRDGRPARLQVRQGPRPGLHDAPAPVGDLRPPDPRELRPAGASGLPCLHAEPEPGRRADLRARGLPPFGQVVREFAGVVGRGSFPRRAPASHLRATAATDLFACDRRVSPMPALRQGLRRQRSHADEGPQKRLSEGVLTLSGSLSWSIRA